MKNYLKTISFAAVASLCICSSLTPMRSLEMPESETLTPKQWQLLDRKYIEYKLFGSVDKAARFIKDAHKNHCIYKVCQYIDDIRFVKIVLFDNECSAILLENCHEDIFRTIFNTYPPETVQKIRKICIDNLNSKNITGENAGWNLFLLLDAGLRPNPQKNPPIVQKMASYINNDNITDIPKSLFYRIIEADKESATIIAKNALTQHNIAKVFGHRPWNNKKMSFIHSLIEFDETCAKIIAHNAITKDNFRQNIAVIDYLIHIDPNIRVMFAQWEGFTELAKDYRKKQEEEAKAEEQRKQKEYEERKRKQQEEAEAQKKREQEWNEKYEREQQSKKQSEHDHRSSSVTNPTTMSLADAYKILFLPTTALPADIKKQYHKLAMQYHPDRNTDKSEAEKKEIEKKMVELNEAYEVLTRRSRL